MNEPQLTYDLTELDTYNNPVGSYRILPTPPQQFSLQRHNGRKWTDTSYCTSIEIAGRVLLRRATAEQAIPCRTIDDLIFAVETAERNICEMLKSGLNDG